MIHWYELSAWKRNIASDQAFWMTESLLFVLGVTKEKGAKLLYDAKVSLRAMQKMMQVLKYQKLHKRKQNIQALAKVLNPILLGWINYYGAFGKTHMNKR